MDLFFESDTNSSSSDDEEVELAIVVGGAIFENLTTERNTRSSYGSIPGRITKNRNFIEAHKGSFRDYFADPPCYPASDFRRRFRMNRDLFLRITDSVVAHDSYFVQKRNAAGKLGLSSLQKITTALRILAYGVTGDLFDEYIKIGETTATLSLKRFVKAIVSIYGDEYMRRPNEVDTAKLLTEGDRRGFPGMLGSIDCMEWEWKNCPTEWSGMYTGRSGKPTIKLEAIASSDTWLWHAFFGLPGSHNDINVLERSPLLNELVDGQAAPVKIMTACVILHNMIVEDERHLYLNASADEYDQDLQGPPSPEVSTAGTNIIQDFVARHIEMRDSTIHTQLQDDLVEHLWKVYSES